MLPLPRVPTRERGSVSEHRTALGDVVDLADLGEHAVRLAADLREQVARDRATAQALREYLEARATPS